MPSQNKKFRILFFACLASILIFSCVFHRPAQCPAVYAHDTGYSLPNRWLIRENGKSGFIDAQGHKIIPCAYDSACDFFENIALVRSGETYSYIDTNGRPVSANKFEQAVPFYGKYAAARKNKKWGLINRRTEWVIQPQYDYLDGYDSEGKRIDLFKGSKLLAEIHNNTSTVLNLDIEYDLVPVRTNGRWTFYSIASNKEILLPGYDDMQSWTEGYKAVKKNFKWGYIDSTGREVVACEFDDAGYFTEGIAVVGKGSYYGAIDPSGKLLIPAIYPLLYACSDGMCAAMTLSSGHKYVFLDRNGNVVLNEGYDNIVDFHEGAALVKKANGWMLINRKGEMLMPDIFENAYPFSNGMAPVQLHGKWGVISACGQFIIKPVSDEVSYFSGGMARIKTGDKWGFADATGRMCIKPRFAYVIRDFENGVAEVLLDGTATINSENFEMELKGTRAYIDRKGRVLWEGK